MRVYARQEGRLGGELTERECTPCHTFPLTLTRLVGCTMSHLQPSEPVAPAGSGWRQRAQCHCCATSAANCIAPLAGGSAARLCCMGCCPSLCAEPSRLDGCACAGPAGAAGPPAGLPTEGGLRCPSCSWPGAEAGVAIAGCAAPLPLRPRCPRHGADRGVDMGCCFLCTGLQGRPATQVSSPPLVPGASAALAAAAAAEAVASPHVGSSTLATYQTAAKGQSWPPEWLHRAVPAQRRLAHTPPSVQWVSAVATTYVGGTGRLTEYGSKGSGLHGPRPEVGGAEQPGRLLPEASRTVLL